MSFFLETKDSVFIYHRMDALSEKKPYPDPRIRSLFLIRILLNPMHFMCQDWCQVTMSSITEFKNIFILFSLEAKKKQSPYYSIFSAFFFGGVTLWNFSTPKIRRQNIGYNDEK